MSRVSIILMLSILMLFANVTTAQNKETDIERLNAKILELQQRIVEIQKKHDEEINVLRQQVNELAGEAGKQVVSWEPNTLHSTKPNDRAGSVRAIVSHLSLGEGSVIADIGAGTRSDGSNP